jgi:hypothetical protein
VAYPLRSFLRVSSAAFAGAPKKNLKRLKNPRRRNNLERGQILTPDYFTAL